ncbi:MAG: thiamine-phosphate kinase [Dehalococcoidales bacterium]|nr:MAG: thiamine-phosphate kinase [Dehalococcoidales bacterium]
MVSDIIRTMKVSELGEFGLIDRLAEMVGHSQSRQKSPLIIGIGDDTAAWQGDSSVQLATVDSLVESVHFTLDTASYEEVGWKSLAVNLSDIAAMGGQPEYALVSLGLPGDTNIEDITDLYRGMLALAEQFQVRIIGGNVVSAPQLVINVTVFGSAISRDSLLTRSTARPGDRVAVTGPLGAAAAGVEMLGKGLEFEPEVVVALRNALLRPLPRIAEGQLLVEHDVRAAIDISDGLIADLDHICQASRVGARIEADRVPVALPVQASFGERALGLALAGGEDYELLFTASADRVEKVRKAATCPICAIGEVVIDDKHRVMLVDSQGSPVSPSGKGWDHFRVERGRR